jgi:choline dehydrogenase-like flavoprotein
MYASLALGLKRLLHPPQSPQLDRNAPTGRLSEQEMEGLLALLEVLIPVRLWPSRQAMVEMVNHATETVKGLLNKYRASLPLLDKSASKHGIQGGFVVAGAEARQRILESLMWQYPRRTPVDERFAYMQRFLAQDNPWETDNPQRDTFTNGGDMLYALNTYRVKAVGGTTLHWSGMTPRLHESDFEMRSRYGITEDWPVPYAELEPYYCEAEAELGVSGEDDNPFGPPRSRPYPMPGFPASYHEHKLRQACQELGMRFHTLPQARASLDYRGRPACQTFSTCMVCPIRAKYSADWHVELAEATGNVTVIPLANVLRFETDQRRRVARAIYAGPDKVEHQVTSSLFVLAAHAVESARLLLLSKSADFPDGLANSSGLVGKNFMEHPIYSRRGRTDEMLYPYLNGFETIQCEQFYDEPSRNDQAAFILQGSAAGPTPPQIVNKVIDSSGHWGVDLEHELRSVLGNEFGRTFRVEAIIESLPVETNRVDLDREVTDYFGNPCPQIFFSLSDYEKAAIRRADETLKAMLNAMGARSIQEPRLGFAAHPSGTCRMGNRAATSVVDRNLRTYDVSNLYIVGSSVFPTSGALQLTLTIAALALRLGDHLLSKR